MLLSPFCIDGRYVLVLRCCDVRTEAWLAHRCVTLSEFAHVTASLVDVEDHDFFSMTGAYRLYSWLDASPRSGHAASMARCARSAAARSPAPQ